MKFLKEKLVESTETERKRRDHLVSHDRVAKKVTAVILISR